MERIFKLIFSVLLATFISGCSTIPRVDENTLVRLYALERKSPKKSPLIFIPGMMGTVLKDVNTGRTVWGEFGKRLFDALALPIDTVTLVVNRDSLVASRPIGKVGIIPGLLEKEIYDKVRRIAIEAGGYEMGKTSFSLSYDWRRDLVEAARQLGELIDDIKKQSGNPEIKVNLICHSAGGLIARYYIKYGMVDVLDKEPLPMPSYIGAKNINKVIMLGTPNSGSVEAFRGLHEGFKISMIGYFRPDIIFTMPSVYESLPFEEGAIFVDEKGNPLKVNIYAADNWQKYGWSVFNRFAQRKKRHRFISQYGKERGLLLYEEHMVKEYRFLEAVLKRAKHFHEALLKGDIQEEKKHVTYILLGSDCQPTLRRVILKEGDPDWKLVFSARDKELKDILFGFGDGSVTKESLLGIRRSQTSTGGEISRLPAAYEVFICETHGDLTLSPTFQDNILHAILDD